MVGDSWYQRERSTPEVSKSTSGDKFPVNYLSEQMICPFLSLPLPLSLSLSLSAVINLMGNQYV
jgi:hypothetical protein